MRTSRSLFKGEGGPLGSFVSVLVFEAAGDEPATCSKAPVSLERGKGTLPVAVGGLWVSRWPGVIAAEVAVWLGVPRIVGIAGEWSLIVGDAGPGVELEAT